MENDQLLDKLQTAKGLRALTARQVRQLCAELRRFLVENVSRTGGHLASNLGVVELTVALHRVFESPVDQIVWDVGHQAYVHKILTGRKAAFHTLRQEGGLSGFPKSQESVHDAFVAGHASTAISAADGIARAKRIKGEPGHVIAVIGDGAFTGGMAYEGLLNAAREENRNLIVILNDNKMSISKNSSAIGDYLARLRSNHSYFRLKDLTKSALRAIPMVGERAVELVAGSKSRVKDMIYNSSFFEELGYVHMGPVDGHDTELLESVLQRAKALGKPVFIHVATVKGKGYSFAEKNPGHYHGVSKFNPNQGSGDLPPGNNFSDAFGSYLTELAEADEKVCAVTAAMKYGTGLHHFAHRFKGTGRFADVGIAEQHAVTYSAGLAAGGLRPVCALYSTFLQRSYDQILHDCAIERRHVVLAVDRAGLVGEDGETHQGLFDCAFLSTIPGMTIYSPATYRELQSSLRRALYNEDGVVAVRYPRGSQPELAPDRETDENEDFLHIPGDKILLVSYGREWAEVCGAAAILRKKGVEAGLLKLTKVFPVDKAAVAVATGYRRILFVEEGIRNGGIGQSFLACLAQMDYAGTVHLQAVDGFVAHATVKRQIKKLGLDAASVAALAERLVRG